MGDFTNLLKECEADKGSEALAEGIKKAKVGIINLKAYLQQVCLVYTYPFLLVCCVFKNKQLLVQ